MSRQLALVGIVFAASLVLLAGLSTLVVPGAPRASGPLATGAAGVTGTPTPSGSPSPSGTAPADRPSVPASGPAVPASADPTPRVTEAVLIGAGNIADCASDGASATAGILDQLEGTVFTTGDNARPDGTLRQFEDCYGPTWGRALARTRPAAGDVDWRTPDLAGYAGYFGGAARPDGVSWYSYDLGSWHVVVLDSACERVGGCGPASDQGRWLAKDLSRARAGCTVAIWDRPRFSSGASRGDEAVEPFWDALIDAGADVVINGHDADYERFTPQDADGRPDKDHGLREFVVGTGGAPLQGFGTVQPNSAFRIGGAHGLLRIALHEKSYAWTFIQSGGGPTDAGKADCH